MRHKINGHNGRLAKICPPETFPANRCQFIEFCLMNTAAGLPHQEGINFVADCYRSKAGGGNENAPVPGTKVNQGVSGTGLGKF